MKKVLRNRFWLETGIAVASCTLLLITLVWHDWIEIIFNVDPDQGSGLLEWSNVGALLAAVIAFTVLSYYEWHRTLAFV